jgi:hypothetical protein
MLNKKFKGIALILLLSVSLLSVSFAADSGLPDSTVYVSTTGSDSNTGTVNSPLKTIAKAVEVVPNGGTVFIKAGIYKGDEGNARIIISKDINIIGENQATTIIDGENVKDIRDQNDPDHSLNNKLIKQGSIFVISPDNGNDNVTGKILISGLTLKNIHDWVALDIYDKWNNIEGHSKVYSSIENCTFENNRAAIEGDNFNLIGSTFKNNSGYVAPIQSFTPITVDGCTFEGNVGMTTTLSVNLANATVKNSYFSGNIGGRANNIKVSGNLHVYNSTFVPAPEGSSESQRPSIFVDLGYGRVYIDGQPVKTDDGYIW